MSKTKNEERREIVNKRLAEIIDKDVIPKKERVEEPISHDIPEYHNHSNKSPNKLKTYLIRIGIIIVLFFVLKSLDFGKFIDSSFEVSKDKEEVKVEAKVTVPAKDVKTVYNFSFKKNEHIIIFGNYQSEEEALQQKQVFSEKFVEFSINHFYLPENSNSKEKVYKLYLGPINGEANAKQWSKLIEIENELLSF